MEGTAAVSLAQALAAAAGDAELAVLARAEAEADGTTRLRTAVALLRAAAGGSGQAGVPVVDAEVLGRIALLVRRDEVLEALYEAEARGEPPELASGDDVAAMLARGTWEERAALDEAIGSAATDWRVERLAMVDRVILRLALWELRHRPEVPAAVVISEAVRLAKGYSTGRSGAFVNGVLGRLERDTTAGG